MHQDVQVDACQLLQCLQAAARQETLSDVSAEAVSVRGLPERQLKLMVRFDFTKFLHNGGMVDG
jgi:hypothetical protein